MLRRTYDSIMTFASHRHAVYWLNFVAFVESSVFPLPPDPLYIAMILKNRDRAWAYAAMCTASSVIGGIIGYYIGYALYEAFGVYVIEFYGAEQAFLNFKTQFDEWGAWIIALKGLTPIPYKIVTIASGAVQFDFKTFIFASVVARGFRFFTLGGLLWYYGPPIKTFIDKNLYLVTTAGLVALLGGFVLFKYVF